MFSCNKKADLISYSSNESDSLKYSKWERLKITNDDTIIYRPCDADNAFIEFKKNKLIINYGQEELSYVIEKKTNRDNKTIFKLNNDMKFSYSIVSSQLLKISINDNEYFYTTYQNSSYKEVIEPIKNCSEDDDLIDRPSPENTVDNLIFTRDKSDSLQINTEILDYISKNTNRENSAYLFALEDYGKKSRESIGWSIDEFSKIKAYIFNTSYPLRKKYWNDKFDEWYNGKPENFLGSRGMWEENNYYGLPKLEEYVRDFIITHHWTQY